MVCSFISFFSHRDQSNVSLSSAIVAYSQNRITLDTYGYDAFGQTVNQTGSSDNKYQYAGEQFDSTTGDYYLRQRFYDTSSGRFGRMDTYEGYQTKPVSLHKYIYADANPIFWTDPSGFMSMPELASARNIADILSTSIRTVDRFLTTIDKVTSTVDLISTIYQSFQLMSNPILMTRSLGGSVSNQIKEILNPDFLEEAVMALRSNASRIVSSVITQQLPQEKQKVTRYLKNKDSSFVIYAPSILSVAGGTSIPTGIKVRGKSVNISTKGVNMISNEYADRLIGVGMISGGKDYQFFRMDFGRFNHPRSPDRNNYDVWQDSGKRFHFHVPKNPNA